MAKVAEKIASTGNDKILLTERGTTFGYNNLVVDMRSLPTMAETGYPVVFDATHSVQQPGGLGNSTGGDRTMVPYLARAAVATGSVSGVFLEVHQDPDNAPSDGPNMVRLDTLKDILEDLKEIYGTVKRKSN
jgi:2-dehydro-3-deoxyphosphooctonate aldolase (KDO 8-P synthase)